MSVEWPLLLVFIFGSLILLMASNLPVAFCFMTINLIGVYIFWSGEAGLHQLILSIFSSVATFTLMPIPLFVLMGEIMFQSQLGYDVIRMLDKWLGRLPGRLGLLGVASGVLFASTSGSTIASTAMLGTLLTPEMERYGYKKPISIGAVMGSGGLAMLIPPSGFAVLLASIAEISVGKLLIAGIIPGLILASFYASYVIVRCTIQRSIAPTYEITPAPLSVKLKGTVRFVLPLGVIIFLVLGLIFLGVATPTESAAMGALGSFVLAWLYRRMSWEVLKKSVKGTLQVTVMTLVIVSGAMAFSQILSFSGVTRGVVELVSTLTVTPITIIALMQLTILFLGTFMCNTSIMMVTLPIYMPICQALGFDPIWFGLIMLINLEMALTTPPFGLLLFVMKGVAPEGTSMLDIYKAGFPFLMCDFSTMVLCMFFPMLTLWLPGMM
jgi:tripartite ATP-independent transporter DctM subunit